MKNIYKAYVKNYIDRNKKLLLFVTILQFMVLPFLLFSLIKTDTSQYTYQNCLLTVGGIFCAIGCMMSLFVPLYQYRFMMQKRSCDLYYALPLSRKALFFMQYALGLGCVFLPLSINYLLAVVLVIVSTGMPSLFLTFGMMWLTAVLFISCLYTLYIFLIVRCSNFLDAVVVCIAYTLIPFVILGVFASFMSRIMDMILVSSMGAGEIISFIDVIRVLSLPSYLFVAMIDLIYQSFQTSSVIHSGFLTNLQLGIYWILVSAGACYASCRCFQKRKVEQAEHPTVSFLTYPLLILLSAFVMILMVFMMDSNIILWLLIVFILYLLMVFFANRRLQLNAAMIGKFVLIVLAVFTFSEVFQRTSGFGAIREYPDTASIESVDIDFFFNTNKESGILYQPKDTKNDSVKELIIHHLKSKKVKDEAMILQLLEVQEKAVQSHINEDTWIMDEIQAEENQGFVYLDFKYQLRNGKIIYRSYNVTGISEDMMKFVDELIEHKIIDLYNTKENNIEIIYK